MMHSLPNLLAQIEQLRESKALLFATNDQASPPRQMAEKDVLAFYDCLRELEEVDQLDLILHTGGGEVQTARKLVDLLQQKANKVCVLVPYKARSAGTLICLGADEVVMGPLAELSPIDPQISMRGNFSGNGPKSMSAEDIRCFRAMAQDWFGVADNGVEMLTLLSEKIFPTTLTDFYRATAHIREIALALFARQRPDLSEEQRSQHIQHLMHGFHNHDAYLNRQEAAAAGIAVQSTTEAEEGLLWQIYEAVHGMFAETAVTTPTNNAGQPPVKQSVDALIANTTTVLSHCVQTVEYIQNGGQGGPLRMTMNAQWQKQADAGKNGSPYPPTRRTSKV